MSASNYEKAKKILGESVIHNSNNKLQLKSGGSEMLITTKGNNVNVFVQEGSDRIMFEGKTDDLKAIKEFLQIFNSKFE